MVLDEIYPFGMEVVLDESVLYPPLHPPSFLSAPAPPLKLTFLWGEEGRGRGSKSQAYYCGPVPHQRQRSSTGCECDLGPNH